MPSPLDSFPPDPRPDERDSPIDLTLEAHKGVWRPQESGPARTRRRQALALGTAATASALVAFTAVSFWSRTRTGGEQEAAVKVPYEPLVEPGRADPKPVASAVDPAAPASVSPEWPPTGQRRVPESTGLVVITEPPGARVTVNGVGWGATPLTVGYLAPGLKRIRVSKTGYESAERVVGADTSQTRVTLRIELRAASGPRQAQ